MSTNTQQRVVSFFGRFGCLFLSLLVCHLPLQASNSDMVMCREELSSARRIELADKLRTITGWPEIMFDNDGILKIGSAEPRGGSQTARNLIKVALSGSNAILLEDASNRSDMAFARVTRRWKQTTKKDTLIFVVQLDFSDFDHLIGDQAALKAFDAGWVFLHEIDHIVNDSVDAKNTGEAGECEDHINLMRRECNLPVRADYFFTYLPYVQQSEFRTRFVRLAFDREDNTTTKRRRYWVVWDATLVGGLDTKQIPKPGVS